LVKTLLIKTLGADETPTLPFILELLTVKDRGIDDLGLSPEARKDKTLEALRRIVLIGSEARPLVIAVEDLHWTDKSSEEAFKILLDAISGAQVFLVFTYRPEFVHTWGGKSYHSQVNLMRLSNRETLEMAAHILGTEIREAQVLDMFAGSGCFGIAILAHVPNAHVTFAELEDNALEQIKINLDLNEINESRYEIIKTNIFSNIPEAKTYDYILANPPYIPTSDPNMDDSVLKYEPSKSLYGGDDGLDLIRPFLTDAYRYLKPGGKIYMKFGYEHQAPLEQLLRTLPYTSHSFHKDQYTTPRFLFVTK